MHTICKRDHFDCQHHVSKLRKLEPVCTSHIWPGTNRSLFRQYLIQAIFRQSVTYPINPLFKHNIRIDHLHLGLAWLIYPSLWFLLARDAFYSLCLVDACATCQSEISCWKAFFSWPCFKQISVSVEESTFWRTYLIISNKALGIVGAWIYIRLLWIKSVYAIKPWKICDVLWACKLFIHVVIAFSDIQFKSSWERYFYKIILLNIMSCERI